MRVGRGSCHNLKDEISKLNALLERRLPFDALEDDGMLREVVDFGALGVSTAHARPDGTV